MFPLENSTDSGTEDAANGSNIVMTAEYLLEHGLCEERFRVDRKKLEDMIQSLPNPSSVNENADDFFRRISSESNAHISWPSKLKIGAKSKKDPHVKVVGIPESVDKAKKMILEVLDTKQKNRVTLKMDVSHSDHSYIIGKGGFKIQQVMEETGCHIHFPDSNRNCNAEKSNQVSVAGEAEGVELARSKIRGLLPIVFMFELPSGVSAKPGDETSPPLQHIQQTYSFNIAFKALPFGKVLLVARGCHRMLHRLSVGLSFLMEYLTGSKTVPSSGIMKTEIAVQHHSFVMGLNSVNVKMIMNKTGAVISFPDPGAPNKILVGGGTDPSQTLIPVLQNPFAPPLATAAPAVQAGPHIIQTKTSVLIQGGFNAVCAAWNEILKSLPLSLMFDLKEGQDVDSILINRLMEQHKVTIMVRPKLRENIKSVIIRGAEKDSDLLFQTRLQILGLNFGSDYQTNLYSPPPHSGQPETSIESLALLRNLIHENPGLISVLNKVAALPAQMPVRKPAPNFGKINPHFQNGMVDSFNQLHLDPNRNDWGRLSLESSTSDYNSRILSQEFPPFLPPPNQSLLTSSYAEDSDSGYSTRSSRYFSGNCAESSASSTSSISNDTNDSGYRRSQRYSSPNASHNGDISSLMAEYGNKKMMATKAMFQDINEDVRTPTRTWSGFGFSKSMPEYAMKLKDKKPYKDAIDHSTNMPKFNQAVPYQSTGLEFPQISPKIDPACVLNYPEMGHFDQGMSSPYSISNVWENMPPASPSVGYNSIKDLKQLFAYFNLEKYIDIFMEQEIDMQTFLTLTDCDLQQLNVSFTDRRRMLHAIATMRDTKKLDFKAAPGAERKMF